MRDFRLLWCGRSVSLLGSWLLVVAVPAHVFAVTGSLVAAGIALAVEFLPQAVVGPFAGVVADRWDRRWVMVAADVVRAGAVLLLLVGDVRVVYLALLLESAGTVVFRPAAQALVPAVVGTGSALTSANGVNAVTDGLVRLVGPPLGGALFAVAGFGLLVWVDFGTYLVSALAVVRTASRPVPKSARQRVLPELRAGLAFVAGNRTIRSLLVVSALFLGANACLAAIVVPFGMTVLGGATATGVLMSALGIGFLGGGALQPVLIDRVPFLLAIALVVTGGGFALLFSASAVVVAVIAAVVIGLAGSLALGTTQTVVQRVTPDAVLGRVSAALFTAEAFAAFAGAVLGPVLAKVTSLTWAGYVAGGLAALSGALAAASLGSSDRVAMRTDPPG
ncbi:putative MFS family arabinose efflux permease [Actinokineospora cianjurensis]|uniref:Putative MFS family arabinose efflux permease n=1 Tax=Actinokineospora cianjurensis TaxID=585224 RepID=A0A421B9X3_9PSEU|nr:putative MFS family arabinose efflux permease [Actinokineospora cianjurensis]